MVKIITNQSGTKGFVCQGQFITDPYSSECMRSVVDPKQYYGLTDDELIHFEHLKPLKEEPQPSYEELVKNLKGMKFFIVRWSGDASPVIMANYLMINVIMELMPYIKQS